MTKSRLFALAAIISSLILSGCSAPPGTGHWQTTDGGAQNFTLLKVEFDGKAELFVPTQEAALLRCFWGASGHDRITLQCAYADENKDEVFFEFKETSKETGVLSAKNAIVAEFKRIPRE